MHCRFGCVFVYEFLSTALIINVIKWVTLPYAKMRILLNVAHPFPLVNFLTQIFHNRNRSVVWGNFNHRFECALRPFSRQRRSHPDYYFKVAASLTAEWLSVIGAVVECGLSGGLFGSLVGTLTAFWGPLWWRIFAPFLEHGIDELLLGVGILLTILLVNHELLPHLHGLLV